MYHIVHKCVLMNEIYSKERRCTNQARAAGRSALSNAKQWRRTACGTTRTNIAQCPKQTHEHWPVLIAGGFHIQPRLDWTNISDIKHEYFFHRGYQHRTLDWRSRTWLENCSPPVMKTALWSCGKPLTEIDYEHHLDSVPVFVGHLSWPNKLVPCSTWSSCQVSLQLPPAAEKVCLPVVTGFSSQTA